MSLLEINSISQQTIEWRKKDTNIVFTNGCFDLLHKGHLDLLSKASTYGDILIVGLNSDSSVRKLKGPSRPVNTEDDRAYILAALESVDYVVLFENDTPYELIKTISPHTLVKGGDYEGKDVIGQELVEELRLVEFVEGRSTTRTIQRIKENETNNK